MLLSQSTINASNILLSQSTVLSLHQRARQCYSASANDSATQPVDTASELVLVFDTTQLLSRCLQLTRSISHREAKQCNSKTKFMRTSMLHAQTPFRFTYRFRLRFRFRWWWPQQMSSHLHPKYILRDDQINKYQLLGCFAGIMCFCVCFSYQFPRLPVSALLPLCLVNRSPIGQKRWYHLAQNTYGQNGALN